MKTLHCAVLNRGIMARSSSPCSICSSFSETCAQLKCLLILGSSTPSSRPISSPRFISGVLSFLLTVPLVAQSKLLSSCSCLQSSTISRLQIHVACCSPHTLWLKKIGLQFVVFQSTCQAAHWQDLPEGQCQWASPGMSRTVRVQKCLGFRWPKLISVSVMDAPVRVETW